MSWWRIGLLDDIPRQGSRIVETVRGNLVTFRSAEDEVFTVVDKCPHRGGPLSDGIMHGRSVTCPLHGWKVRLDTGAVEAPDEGCVRSFPTRVTDGEIYVELGELTEEAPGENDAS